ncbi:MAG: glycosyltransferase family 2 protein [Neisseria sp.]|nr:glycosyltransferase family 2 protein [Neisseria sp.]
MNVLALIPHYNHAATITAVAQSMKRQGLDVLVVDDGSAAECRPVLDALAAAGTAEVLYREINGGKGAAVKAGLRYAVQHGYSHILQVDADGQHNLDDAAKLLAEAEKQQDAVICAWPQYGSDAPKARLYGRKITDFWNMLHTGSRDIKDGMCGFRLYPLAAAHAVVCSETVGNRMDFDTEILVRLYWRGVLPVWVKTPVRYQADGISHFRAWRDNWLISKMHARLFVTMLQQRLCNRGRLKSGGTETDKV